MVLIASSGWIAHGGELASAQTNDAIRIVEICRRVEILQPGAPDWMLAATNQTLKSFYRIRTGEAGSVGLMWPDHTVLRFGAFTEVEIRPPDAANTDNGLHLLRGILSFFHRGNPGRVNIITGSATAGIKGTEFVMEVAESNGVEQTKLFVIDGAVRFSNERGERDVTNGQQAVAERGRAPSVTSGFIAKNILQWCFYYPGILDLSDLPLATEEQRSFGDSLAAYRDGDLLAALAKYPDARQPASDAARVYHAALLLGASQVAEAETELSLLPATSVSQRLAIALRTLIAAVKHEPGPSPLKSQMASEFLAASYFEQSRAIAGVSLPAALSLARQAVTADTNFGFGWERVAELEFSFGRTDRASEALGKALQLSGRNAQALAVKGFLLAARNQPREAVEWFDRAMAVDSALANAWLGRGLCRIRRGDLKGGREDLLIAAAMEPQRAGLRSYLAKAWSDTGDDRRAFKELHIAERLDPNDPTAWLYSALLEEQDNRLNEAVRDLEKSQELNTNRSVYRSQLLLDQDSAVRSANLARIYDEAGLSDVAVREAGRAVAADYANFSAHLFLANSYEQLREQSPFDLRYETPAFSEYLLASLLGPADGRLLAQPVTQQEYTSLFQQDTMGFSSSTEYLSRGAWSQYAAQYGTLRDSSYAIESDYSNDPGQTPNGGQESLQLSVKVKQMLTPSDGLFIEALDFHQTSGDLSQRYDPSQADTSLDAHEKQEPSVLAGLDHKWSDTQQTLLLASIFNDTLSFSDQIGQTYLLGSPTKGASPFLFTQENLMENFENRLMVDSFEVQHLASISQFQTIAGIRLQIGSDHLANEQSPTDKTLYPIYFPQQFVINQSFLTYSLRITPYLYEYWHLTRQLCLIGGLAYDYQILPENALFAPLSNQEKVQNQVSPKAGLVWEPASGSAVRAAYTQSLGGANLDQSLRLEPTQVAGFTQAYTSVMPASLVGGIGGARFETADLSLERRFNRGTYLALSAEFLRSTADQSVGGFSRVESGGYGPAIQLPEQLVFQECSLDFSLHQLFGNYFSLGARYRLADARLSTVFPQVGPALGNSSDLCGLLHLVSLDASFQHPSGFFASIEGEWWRQDLGEDLSSFPGDQFWQANAQMGYRSPRRRVEISLGVLNITGQDYCLSPINLYPNLPRQRTFAARLQFNF